MEQSLPTDAEPEPEPTRPVHTAVTAPLVAITEFGAQITGIASFLPVSSSVTVTNLVLLVTCVLLNVTYFNLALD